MKNFVTSLTTLLCGVHYSSAVAAYPRGGGVRALRLGFVDEMVARDGVRILRFAGERLAHASSARRGAQRWSELVLYRTAGGEYILQKIGRSSVAHDPECELVNHRMPSWLEAREEGKVHRTPCVLCSPAVGDEMDPHTRFEPQRYTVFRAPTLEDVVEYLSDGRTPAQLPRIIVNLLEQVL